MKTTTTLLLVLFSFFIKAQEGTPSKNTVTFSIGQGFEDALTYYSQIPTLGLGYERKLTKRFTAYGRILTYYRRSSSLPFIGTTPPSIGRIYPGTTSPFITSDDINSSQNLGFKDLKSTYSYKALSIPLAIGICFTPLRYKNHSINIYTGVIGMYESRNYFIEYVMSEAKITTSDNVTITAPLTLISETYFRNIVVGESIGLGYQYNKDNFSIELYVGENNILGPANSSIVYDLSLRLKYRI